MPAAPRSLLERADLAALRRTAAARPGPFGPLVTCLAEGGALAADPADPEWADRDRLVVADDAAAQAVRAAFGAAGWICAAPGEALATALGAAMAAELDGAVFRAWCLLGPDAVDDGFLWGPARAAAVLRVPPVVVAVAPGHGARGLADCMHAAGWAVHRAAATDVVALLGALDHALHPGDRPVLVLGLELHQ
jgi:transketolase N-terminal domain/subunit